MVHPSGESTRPQRPPAQELNPLANTKDKPLFADGFPFLLLTSPSLASLNSKLDEQGLASVNASRFRPNIQINGNFPAFAEDSWGKIRIGEAEMRNVKPCTRCIFVNVDPETGTKDPGGEPLKTLRSYRSPENQKQKDAWGNAPYFGINLGLDVEGEIKVGDRVWVLRMD